MKFRQTLPEGERHLVGRLESFGDIVVGFSMSQLALQLEIPKTPHDVFGHGIKYVVFFGAFVLLGIFWLRFHRIMAIGFAPRTVDIWLLFGFLAFVALVPYSLITYTRLVGPAGYARESVALYLVDFLGVSVFSWILSIRGLRRAWSVLDEPDRPAAWRPVLAGFVVVPVVLGRARLRRRSRTDCARLAHRDRTAHTIGGRARPAAVAVRARPATHAAGRNFGARGCILEAVW